MGPVAQVVVMPLEMVVGTACALAAEMVVLTYSEAVVE